MTDADLFTHAAEVAESLRDLAPVLRKKYKLPKGAGMLLIYLAVMMEMKRDFRHIYGVLERRELQPEKKTLRRASGKTKTVPDTVEALLRSWDKRPGK